MVAVLGLGGLAACGDDDGADVRETGEDGSGGSGSDSGSDDGSGSSGATETTEAPTDDGGGSQEFSEGVEGYCEAVTAYVELIGEAIEDPESAGAELQAAANAYIERAVGLGELSAEDQARFEECSQEAADAATEFVPGG